MDQFDDVPPERFARDRLLRVVRVQLGNVPISANSMLDLVALIERGVARMAESGELGQNDIARAERATADFLQEVSIVGSHQGERLVTANSIRQAQSRLCPGFWPFC